jgi:hypothetical protein
MVRCQTHNNDNRHVYCSHMVRRPRKRPHAGKYFVTSDPDDLGFVVADNSMIQAENIPVYAIYFSNGLERCHSNFSSRNWNVLMR